MPDQNEGLPRILHKDVNIQYTGLTGSPDEVAIASYTVPGKLLVPDFLIQVRAWWREPTAGSQNQKIFWGATAMDDIIVSATTTMSRQEAFIFGNDSLSSQTVCPGGPALFDNDKGAIADSDYVAAAEDTTGDVVISLKADPTNVETVEVAWWMVLLFP